MGLLYCNIPEGFSADIGETITLEIGERLNNQLTAKIINIGADTTGKLTKKRLL